MRKKFSPHKKTRNKKKQEMFIASWVNSYKELKKFDRSYHEFVISVKHMKNGDEWFWNEYPV